MLKAKRKNILLIIIVLLAIPFLVPMITMLLEIIFNLGKYLGTFASMINKGIC